MDQENIEYNFPKLAMRLMQLCFSQDDASFQYRNEYTTTSERLSPNSLVIANTDIRIGQKIEFDYEWLASRNVAVEPWSDSYVWLKDATVPFYDFYYDHSTSYCSLRFMYENGTCNAYRIGIESTADPASFWFTERPGEETCNMHNDVAKYHISIEIQPGKNGENPRFVYKLTELDHPHPLSYTHTVVASRPDFPNMALVFGSNRVAYQISNLVVGKSHVSHFSYASPDAKADDPVVFGTSNYQNLHFHKEVELVFVQTESIDCLINGDSLDLTPNQILLSNRNIHHQSQPCEKQTKVTILNFDVFKYLDEGENDMNALYAFLRQNHNRPYQVYSGEDAGELLRLIHFILEETNQRKPAYELYLKSYLLWIGAHLSREGFLSESNIGNDRNLSKIVPAIQYINKHFTEKLTLSQISRAVTIEKCYLCKLFRTGTNSTIVDYINFLRLSHAVEQLRRMNLSIAEAAYQSGFSSMQYFNRLFKKRFNCTPMEYRKKMLWS